MKKVIYIEGYDEDKLFINGKYFSGLDTMTLSEVLRLLERENVLKLEIKSTD